MHWIAQPVLMRRVACVGRSSSLARYRLGIDIGGTFTDFSLLDEDDGEFTGFKSPTVPDDPGRRACSTGSRRWSPSVGIDPGDIDYLVHGTTIAVNTVIQRNGAALGLLVTARLRRRARDPAAATRQPGELHGDAPAAADPALPRGRGQRADPGRRHRRHPARPRRAHRSRRRRLVEQERVEGLVVCVPQRLPDCRPTRSEARDVLAERCPGPPRRLLARGLAADPRVRAHDGGDPQRVRAARTSCATSARWSASWAGPGVRVPLVHHEVERRRDDRPRRPPGHGGDAAVGPGLGRHRRELRLRPRRLSRPDHARHGRHQRRHRAGPRTVSRCTRPTRRRRLPGRDAGGRRLVDRGRRRLDRLARLTSAC